MGVDVSACFEYGYKVCFEDIPDGEERLDSEFEDISDDYEMEVCGRTVWRDDLVTGDNAYAEHCDQTWYIGVKLPSGLTAEELIEECRSNRDVVRAMYELVMRKPPTDEPRVHVYARWW